MTDADSAPHLASVGASPESLERALFEIKRVIAGQDVMLERVLVCLLAGGHLLIEGVPGLAKTLTIKTTANVLGGTFNRIQFTPDLLPSDLVGTRIYRPGTGEFDVELGPVFCNFLLADEINRAPAKVQSALLEVMQERQVTIGHESFPVPDTFLVMATQNPIESEGTYPLPEAQLDRFMLKVVVGYPAPEEELTVVERSLAGLASVRRTIEIDELAALRAATETVFVDPALSRYAIRLATATREPDESLRPYIAFGASPRGPDRSRHGGPGARVHARAGLRAPAGSARAREGRVPPPHRPHVRGARVGRRRRLDPRPRARGGADAGDRARRKRGLSMTVAHKQRTPARPGPWADS